MLTARHEKYTHALACMGINCVFFCLFLRVPEAINPQQHVHSLRGAVGKLGVAGPAGAQTCNP